MASPFLGEIRVFSFNFPPKGWAFCNGQTLPIQQNQALFSLLGTTYGGDGRTTFQLPNFQGNCVISAGTNPNGVGYVIGQIGGESAHTLLVSEMPQHSHPMQVSSASANLTSAVSTLPAVTTAINAYGSPGTNLSTLGPGSFATGQGGPHENRSPYLVLSLCIALAGIFPSQN
jgi:microcystin-dependent protein